MATDEMKKETTTKKGLWTVERNVEKEQAKRHNITDNKKKLDLLRASIGKSLTERARTFARRQQIRRYRRAKGKTERNWIQNARAFEVAKSKRFHAYFTCSPFFIKNVCMKFGVRNLCDESFFFALRLLIVRAEQKPFVIYSTCAWNMLLRFLWAKKRERA